MTQGQDLPGKWTFSDDYSKRLLERWEQADARVSGKGYINNSICLACRLGPHYKKYGQFQTEKQCSENRQGNACPDYVDPTPTREEYIDIYARELEAVFSAKIELDFVTAFGNARHRRVFLRDHIGIPEADLRRVEDAQGAFRTDTGQFILRKIRLEL